MADRQPDPEALAATVPWFARLPPDARRWLAASMEPMSLQGGETLFRAGDAADALFLLLSGSLGAFSATDPKRLVGQVVAGETVGELGLITERPRNATVQALRDSELLRVPRAAFDALAGHDPHAVMAMARLALERATQPAGPHAQHAGPRTLAILPQTADVDARAFAERLGNALERYGNHAVIDVAAGAGHDAAWFSALETAHRHVIYVADREADEWRKLCMRQADALVLLADAGSKPAPWSEAAQGVQAALPRPEHLVLVHSSKPRLGAARRWAKVRAHARLHHLRDDHDVPRIARLIAGRAIGLVLSGGGARGFAHLGAIKALREAGVEIDAVGGTSIGGIIGAGVAADWSTEEMLEVFRRSFVDTNPLSDYTLPLISMVSGRKVSKLLRRAFGEREIEDLVLPFFCVSSNLTEGRAAVHRSGPLWQWLRASVAIPGVLPPVFHGGRVYVDGGVINNLPVDVMHEWLHGEVIAVDIGGDHALRAEAEEFDLPPWWKLLPELFGIRRRPGILQILLRAGMVNSGAATLSARSASSLLIMPPLAEIDLLEWKAFERAVDIGYQHTLRLIGGPRDALTTQAPVIGV